jgi:hypothetical protein
MAGGLLLRFRLAYVKPEGTRHIVAGLVNPPYIASGWPYARA